MSGTPTFAELVTEGASVPVAGWDFSWFDGRATEERPPWGYSRILARRMATSKAALDIQTGGGEVLAEMPHPPQLLVATESWLPNVAVAARNLRPLGASVIVAADEPVLPFRDNSFDLVASRHPVYTCWEEIGRVLRPGGRFLSQQIADGTMWELRVAMTGPRPPAQPEQSMQEAASAAEAAGLVVVNLRHAALRALFNDIAAVVYFLRKVIWTVPDFTVNRYRAQLAVLHQRIQAQGPFVAHAQRFLIEARKPA